MANALAWINAAYAPIVASVGYGTPASNLNDTVIPVPSGVVSGSLVLVYVWVFYGGISTLPTAACTSPDTGFTLGPSLAYQDTSGSNGTVWAAWYYKWATGADNGNYNFNYNAVSTDPGPGAGGAFSALIVGAAATSGTPFVDTTQSTFSSPATASLTVSAFTPGANNSLLLAGVSWGSAGNNLVTPPSGWTAPINSQTFSGDNIECSWLRQGAAASTGSLTWNSTPGGNNGGGVLIGTIR